MQPVEPAEVHAIRLLLWAGGAPREGDDAALRAELDEGLAEDPYHPVLLRQLARRDGRDPLPLARLSVKGRPGDPRAWSFLAESLPPEARRPTGRPRCAGPPSSLPERRSRSPPSPRCCSRRAGRVRRSPPARQAVQLGPFSPDVLDTYAAVSADLGNCAQAVLASRRALDVFPDDGEPEQRARLESALAANPGEVPAGGEVIRPAGAV